MGKCALTMERRTFMKLVAASVATAHGAQLLGSPRAGDGYAAASIQNDYYRFLPGERESLLAPPMVASNPDGSLRLAGNAAPVLRAGDVQDGWRTVAILDANGAATAVFEKRTAYRGALAYVTAERGVIALVPTFLGDLANIKPRPVSAPADKQLRREKSWKAGLDVPGEYILQAKGDPSWETVAALGPEFIGWTLVANEQGGPERSLFLEPDGTSRELNNAPAQASWAPDELSPLFDVRDFFPNDNVQVWQYRPGYSKRTLLGGYTPTADIGVWNPEFKCGYEVAAVLPDGETATPVVRVRMFVPEEQLTASMQVQRDDKGRAFLERYKNGDAAAFFTTLLGVWNHWHTFFETSMPVEIPDENLLDSARAGIMLARCSYRGLRPTYQVGEGAYTMIPERSHALFPVAAYEFVWAQQMWGLTSSSDAYFQFYLDHYILPDGNFLYNTQDQAEAPLNVGLFLRNAARGYSYTGNLAALTASMPTLLRMLAYVEQRYRYTQQQHAEGDPHHGLIWGSPEADLGDPHNDYPAAHPYYYQNAANVWRGVADYAAVLRVASAVEPKLTVEADRLHALAGEMRADIERSLATTLSRRVPAMQSAGITPFTPEDIRRDPRQLLSYENHRFMQDWFLADWGDADLDLGHLRHRQLSGMQWAGLHMDGGEPRTSNFMEHGTLAVEIRQPDYRPFLLTLYALVCFAADSGNRYSPEDALVPGGFAGEGNKYWWSAVVNSVLQPTLGLRWLLCYEESDRELCHLQKAAPVEWFAPTKRIAVKLCPTRWGVLTWSCVAARDGASWEVAVNLDAPFSADLLVHLHLPDRRMPLSTSAGSLQGSAVLLPRALLKERGSVGFTVR